MNHKYTKDQIEARVRLLKKELGREPSAQDIAKCADLPAIRTIDRLYGGLQPLREKLGFEVIDHTKGSTRKRMAKKINDRADSYEADIINDLFIKHHDINGLKTQIIRHYAYQQWLPDKKHYTNIMSDVGIVDNVKNHVTLIDFFYPESMSTFGGCVRSKRDKLRKHPVSLYDCTHEVIFVCVSPDVSQEIIDKDNSDKGEIKVISLATFNNLWLSTT